MLFKNEMSLFSFLNKSKLDPSDVVIRTRFPVYITLSTIPSRMANTFKIINHTLSKVQGIEKIILNVPTSYKRFPHFNIELELQRHESTIQPELRNRLIINRTPDYGPLTKFLPTLGLVPDDAIIIICDDMCYKLDAYKDIAERQDQNLNKSYSYYVYLYGSEFGDPTSVPQGADMISVYARNVRQFPEWFQSFQSSLGLSDFFESPCFFVDDQVIGFYLQQHGIPMLQMDPNHRLIYIKNCDVAPMADNLNRQTGRASRTKTMEGCYHQLNKFMQL